LKVEPTGARSALDLLVGDSAAMRALRALVKRVAVSDSTVLILGESGTGKELVAQAIHRLSARARNNFVPVNCGAIPSELLESELFGHAKGAFTGAVSDRRGRFEMADSGTLFLDEIGDMRLEMQVKLLRVLQERTIDRVGDDQARKVNVRVVAATHRHLEDAVSAGKFRADLFYRLNVVPLHVPALRERGDDVPVLFEHFARSCAGPGQAPVRAGADLKRWLVAHTWPGNVRELLNFVERLTVLWPGMEVTLADIPAAMLPRVEGFEPSAAAEQEAVLGLWRWDEEDVEAATGVNGASHDGVDDEADASGDGTSLSADELANLSDGSSNGSSAQPSIPQGGVDLRQLMAEFESAWIREAMRMTDGNVSHAAELLGMRRTTFIERLRKYEPSDSRQ